MSYVLDQYERLYDAHVANFEEIDRHFHGYSFADPDDHPHPSDFEDCPEHQIRQHYRDLLRDFD